MALGLGIALSLLGLVAMVVLLFWLAVYAVPLFVGVTAGLWAFETGAGPIGAILVGLVAGIVALVAAQLLFASIRSVPVRLFLAALFAVPAAIAGYHAVLGLAAATMPSPVWAQVFATIGAIVIGFVAAAQLTLFANTAPPVGEASADPASAPAASAHLASNPALPAPASTLNLPPPPAGDGR
jgi:hypothetical protein